VIQPVFHIPVLVDRVLDFLIHDPSGVYVDGTVGGAGHSLAILQRLTPRGRLIGIDLDEKALAVAGTRLKPFASQVVLEHANFAEMGSILQSQRLDHVDGILLDLGVSSYQIDTGKRGFSYMSDGPLDMRMATGKGPTAMQVINEYSESELAQVIRRYGEERRWRVLANAIVQQRQKKPVTTTQELVKIIESVIPFHHRIKTLARVFQAIRIEVNGELKNLQLFLERSLSWLCPGGRLVIIAYHSLEDRMVKSFFTSQANPCECPPELPVCVCGKKPTVRLLTRKVVVPSDQEKQANPRSRSARLRAVEKI